MVISILPSKMAILDPKMARENKKHYHFNFLWNRRIPWTGVRLKDRSPCYWKNKAQNLYANLHLAIQNGHFRPKNGPSGRKLPSFPHFCERSTSFGLEWSPRIGHQVTGSTRPKTEMVISIWPYKMAISDPKMAQDFNEEKGRKRP